MIGHTANTQKKEDSLGTAKTTSMNEQRTQSCRHRTHIWKKRSKDHRKTDAAINKYVGQRSLSPKHEIASRIREAEKGQPYPSKVEREREGSVASRTRCDNHLPSKAF